MPISRNVFIVHGREQEPMEELKNMLHGFSLNPIVLHEQPSGGLTLAEKLEKHSKNVGFAFVILTPDDIGLQENDVQKMKSEMIMPPFINIRVTGGPGTTTQHAIIPRDYIEKVFGKLKPRARQNVIFEMGYFWGLLKRKKVCCLLKGDVEKPSDIEGIVYIPFKDSIREVKDKIVTELKAAGYENLYPPPSPPPYP